MWISVIGGEIEDVAIRSAEHVFVGLPKAQTKKKARFTESLPLLPSPGAKPFPASTSRSFTLSIGD
jgi:hypothetical protein